MRGRWFVVLAAVVAIVVASPALRPSARDVFPLSNYPMFASAVGRRAVVDTATGLSAGGTPVTLSPALVTGTNEVILAVSTVSNAVAAGAERTAGLCNEIAGRVATGRADI